LQKYVDSTNSHLPQNRLIKIALINGPRSIICTGAPQSLYGLNVALRKEKATGQDQSRIPHSQRKLKFSSRFLPVTVPFHCDYLEGVPELLANDISSRKLSFDHLHLAIPVYHTHTGQNLCEVTDLTMSIVRQICLESVQWDKATQLGDVTHVLDFGPGGASGIGGLTQRNKEGTGVQVILAGAIDSKSPDLLDMGSVFDYHSSSIAYASNWEKEFRPKLIRIQSTGQLHIDTAFSRLIGRPPVMVPGMTPCTANETFVAAVTNAGYHVELAGGGQHTEEYLSKRVESLMKLIPAGEEIYLNILFLNPRLWGFQYPSVIKMRSKGIPMGGVVVAAGVPSLDVADDICKNLKDAGVRFVAFKPGSVETIRRVITIAKRNPDMAVVLQWTGGRGGGHHSFEDFHQPMLETYGACRSQKNVILVVGSGFGDDKETIPYLTGDWSRKFDYAPMPFDGILFGSRVMVAKENLASKGVKELIVAAQGNG